MRLLRPAPRWLPFEGGEAFFFEKKEAKNFCDPARMAYVDKDRACEVAKVLWFFFSKNNITFFG
jgi:hypothetical protein